MHRAAILATTLALAIAPAHAQTGSEGPSLPTTCRELIDGLGSLAETGADSVVEDTDNGCRMTDIYIVAQSPSRFRVAELTLEAPSLFEDIANHNVPAQANLTLSGIVLSPDTGSLLHTYIIESQAQPMDLHIAYHWDRDAETIELSEFSVSASDYGSFRVSGLVSNVSFDLAQLQDGARLDQSLPLGASFDQLNLEIDNAHFMGGLFVPYLLSLLPYDQDPRPLVASTIAGVTAFIDALPDETMSTQSKAALITFISGFPRLSGDYSMAVRADPGIALSDMMVDNPLALTGLLSRITVSVQHDASQSQP